MRELLLSLILLSSTVHAQYCMTAGPLNDQDSNLEWLTLTGASGSINYTGCPGVIGVQEFLGQTVFLNAGGNYTVNLQFGTCQGNYSGVGQAWIDFNLNGIFEAGESIGTWSGPIPTAPSAFNFTVPAGATNGQSRMRVTQFEGGTLPINPCQQFTWGSTTDFSIYISNGVDCSSYIGDDYSDPRIVNTLPFSETHSTSICYTSQNPVYSSPDVFYLVKTNGVSSVEVSLCGSSFDTFLSVYDTDGNALGINDDEASCGIQSKLEVNTVGHDTVYVIVEGWGNANGTYQISINEGSLSLSDVVIQNSVLYPNPANESFRIEGIQGAELHVTDLKGALLLQVQGYHGETVDVSGLLPGVYFVHCNKVNEQSIYKLQISR